MQSARSARRMGATAEIVTFVTICGGAIQRSRSAPSASSLACSAATSTSPKRPLPSVAAAVPAACPITKQPPLARKPAVSAVVVAAA